MQDEEKEDDNDQDDDVTESGGIPTGTSGAADGTTAEDGEGMKEKTDKELEEEFAAWQACFFFSFCFCDKPRLHTQLAL